MINYWELLWQKNRLLRRGETVAGRYPDHENYSGNFIQAHSQLSLSFSGEEHFDWHSTGKLKGANLILILHVAGREKPIKLIVYEPAANP